MMTYQKPNTLIIGKELVESLFSISLFICSCTGSGSRVCYGAAHSPSPLFSPILYHPFAQSRTHQPYCLDFYFYTVGMCCG